MEVGSAEQTKVINTALGQTVLQRSEKTLEQLPCHKLVFCHGFIVCPERFRSSLITANVVAQIFNGTGGMIPLARLLLNDSLHMQSARRKPKCGLGTEFGRPRPVLAIDPFGNRFGCWEGSPNCEDFPGSSRKPLGLPITTCSESVIAPRQRFLRPTYRSWRTKIPGPGRHRRNRRVLRRVRQRFPNPA